MAEVVEEFRWDGPRLVHLVRVDGATIRSVISNRVPGPSASAKDAWWKSYLKGLVPSAAEPSGPALRVVDLFSGPGGLALGVRQFAAELGRRVVTELIVDRDAAANDVYASNHDTRLRSTDSVRSLIDFRVRGWYDEARFVYEPEILNPQMSDAARNVDILIAGPPCQGHSNLNNRSRRHDSRNELYLTVPAFALAANARNVIIENVPDVVHDRSRVVQTARVLFEAAGYRVTEGVLAADDMGWPQTRRRFFMVARSEGKPIGLDDVALALLDDRCRPALWAIGDLAGETSDSILDKPTHHSSENQARINWLFTNEEYDLPNSERPECHQDGTTYGAVYGRMRPDAPAPTITTGFMSPGRGRFIHPTERRVLTAREAAAIQGFPYSYRFVTDPSRPPTRSQLAKWIGDAVPMPLGYAACLSALGPEIGWRDEPPFDVC